MLFSFVRKFTHCKFSLQLMYLPRQCSIYPIAKYLLKISESESILTKKIPYLCQITFYDICYECIYPESNAELQLPEGRKLTLKKDNIALEEVDVIVNSANCLADA